jgi:lysophospholipase L1-like esterase
LLACLSLAACGQSGRLTPTDSRSTILAFGDSLTYGTGVAASQSYPTVLDGLVVAKVIRSGVPGEISANGLKRLEGELDRHQARSRHSLSWR